ncbi:MAG: DUF364 domain-containing protein [Spirochaetales bacterium]|nr:DUF364 domain-containing protein [Spirochaetales bacterium]
MYNRYGRMTPVSQRIRDQIRERAEEVRVLRAQIGLIYCAVQLESGATGTAFTFPAQRSGQPCGAGLSGQGHLAGRKAQQLIEHLGSEELVSSALGMAAANAVIAEFFRDPRAAGGDILDHLDIREGDRVCMVGCFLPVLEKLKTVSVDVSAVDQTPKPGAGPEGDSRRLLPHSQVAIITATSIINDTIDDLLRLAAGCREVAILGPSTPLLAGAFRDLPVRCLSGIRIDDPDAVFRIIGEGGGFRFYKNHTTKLNIRLP